MKGINRFFATTPFVCFLLVLPVAFAVTSFFAADIRIFGIQAGLALVWIVLAAVKLTRLRNTTGVVLRQIVRGIDSAQSNVLRSLPVPVLIAREGGEILWYNNQFRDSVVKGADHFGRQLSGIFPGSVISRLDDNQKSDFEYGGKLYTVYRSDALDHDGQIFTYYLHEDTRLKTTYSEYNESRPVVAILMVDNLDDMLRGVKESEKATITGAIDGIIEKLASRTTGLLRRLERGRFLLVIEERHYKVLADEKFDVLNKVRSLSFGERSGVTLSIGIGRGVPTFQECETLARQAMEMALGRGGDQVAVKTKEEFEFFGGVSKGMEKRTKVRTRVIASALRELITVSDNVFIMGHRFGDLDSMGASIGLCRAIRGLGRNAHIVLDREKNLAKDLLERFEWVYSSHVLTETQALSQLNKKSLLIIVDTHRADFLESTALYNQCKTVVVIDHHRKNVDFIGNAVVFYHEPFASSSSEMAAELIQYLGGALIGKTEAEALLSGIMLDTRNFVIRTGVRTFEAAGFLRSRGADPVAVKQLFCSDLEQYKKRAAIVSASQRNGDFAIAVVSEPDDNIKVLASQAADELLEIEGTTASFVLFPMDGAVNISARSLGGVNVQLIMESLGGGGHFTMAGAQLENVAMDDALAALNKAVKNYRKSRDSQ